VTDPPTALLSARGVPHRSGFPIKVILAGRNRLPGRARCFSKDSPAATLIAAASPKAIPADTDPSRVQTLLLASRNGRVSVKALLRELATRGIQSVLIEGGGEVLASAFKEKAVDHIVWFIAPLIIGGRTAPGSVAGSGIARLSQSASLAGVSVSRTGRDICVEADVRYR
jgi:diaminohydroxyphosphoribosylaminopyrimidine deaminase/5-amino-6-(5-phosphoribosylamino)uracil reductase